MERKHDQEMLKETLNLLQKVKEVRQSSNASHMKLAKVINTVKSIKHQGTMMRLLLSDLLDLGKMENQTFKLNKDFFCFFDAIQQAFSMVNHVAQQRKI